MGSTEDQDYKPVADHEDEEEEFQEEDTTAKAVSNSKKRQRDADPDVQRDSDGNAFFPLSAKRRLTIRPFPNGDPSVDIREFYPDKVTRELRPGKGITLPMAQWKQLVEAMPAIQQVVDSMDGGKSKRQK